MHIFMGVASVFGALLSLLTGWLSFGYRGDNASGKDLSFKLTGIMVLAFMVGRRAVQN